MPVFKVTIIGTVTIHIQSKSTLQFKSMVLCTWKFSIRDEIMSLSKLQWHGFKQVWNKQFVLQQSD